jgi:hypothetical protein
MTLISASFHTLIDPFPFILIQAQSGFQVSSVEEGFAWQYLSFVLVLKLLS